MKQILEQLLNQHNLTRDEAYNIMLSIMSGEYDDAQIAGFLMALRAKGETVDEITGFTQAMRKMKDTFFRYTGIGVQQSWRARPANFHATKQIGLAARHAKHRRRAISDIAAEYLGVGMKCN